MSDAVKGLSLELTPYLCDSDSQCIGSDSTCVRKSTFESAKAGKSKPIFSVLPPTEDEQISILNEDLDRQTLDGITIVLSMANKNGGIIIYGLCQEGKNPTPSKIEWLENPQQKERIEQILQSSVTPKVDVKIRPIPNKDYPSKFVLIVEVPKSDKVPHLLSMTATPIPRTLALSLYGDLDISFIKTMPLGRQPITTKLIKPGERASAYNLIRQEINKGNRVFIICPLIEESDTLGVKAVTTEQARLQQEIFPGIKIGLLHGKLKGQEKTKVMADFKNGRSPILVSTSIVEVGVDVPEATIMVIEGAERFGLAQLHQFRGRVGRSERPSYCLLMTDSTTPRGLERLQAMTKFQSGFDLAEFDLDHRGPGDLLGEVQSGWLKLRFAELANTELLKTVREAGKLLMAMDNTLKHWPTLQAKVSQESFHPE